MEKGFEGLLWSRDCNKGRRPRRRPHTLLLVAPRWNAPSLFSRHSFIAGSTAKFSSCCACSARSIARARALLFLCLAHPRIEKEHALTLLRHKRRTRWRARPFPSAAQ